MKFIWLLIMTANLVYAYLPQVNIKKSNYTVKENINIYFTGIIGGEYDWIGIFPINATSEPQNLIRWKWTDGASSKTINFPKIEETGVYEARLFLNNSYTEIAHDKFEVIESSGEPLKLTVTYSKLTNCSDRIFINFENMGANSNDWLALYPTGSNNNWSNVIIWKWIRNMENNSITLKSEENLKMGEYEIRAFFNNTFHTEGVTKPIFVLPCHNAPKLTTSRRVYFKNESVIINFEGMSMDKNNWIGIYKKGEKTLAQNNVAWQWTGERESGQLIFDNLPQGEYDIRAFYNNTYTVQQIKSFKVSSLDKNNFPKALLNGSKNPTLDVQVIYSKDKNRAYIFIDKNRNALFSKEHKGVTAIDYSDKENPIVIAYNSTQTYLKDTIYLTENENALAFINKPLLLPINFITTITTDELEQIETKRIEFPNSFNKIDNFNLFHIIRRKWVENPMHLYFHINESGVISQILNISSGVSDNFYIIKQGRIDENKYFITYYSYQNRKSYKRIYDISNLPSMPLITTIVSDI